MIEEFVDGFSIRTVGAWFPIQEWAFFKRSEGWTRRQVEQVVELLSNKTLISYLLKK